MRNYRFLLCLGFLSFGIFDSFLSFSQKNEELVLHKIDEQNGLSDNNVQCIYKDKNNFMWIGTASGLNLMDGSEITVFKHEHENPNSIGNNNITALTCDRNGLLWIGTVRGISSFDKNNRKFNWYPLNGKDLTDLPENSLLVADTENIYIGTREGLFVLNREKGKIKKLLIPGNQRTFAEDNFITHLVADHSGKIWISTFDGLWSYDKDQKHFSHEVNEKNDPLFTGIFGYCIIDHQGNIWIGTWDEGLKKFDPVSKKLTSTDISSEQEINSLAEIKEPDGNYLICINGYFHAFDPLSNKVISMSVTPVFSKDPNVNNLYASDDNWLWIGTHQGLYFYNPAKSLFIHHRFSDLITTQVVALLEWNDKILVSGRGNNFLKAYDNNLRETDDYSSAINKKDVSCLCLKFSGNHTLKAGTSNGIIDIDLTRQKVKFNRLDFLRQKLSTANFITSLLQDKSRGWWVFPWRYGIWKTDSSFKNFHLVFNNFISQNGQPKPLVIADAVEDKNGNLWLADLDEGIILYNRQTNTFSKPFAPVLGHLISMSQILYYHNKCYSFAGSEVYEWNCENPQLEKISPPFQNDKPISSIAIDSSGNLWMATKKGLLVYDFKNKIFNRFTTADGLITNEIDATLMCTSKGKMIIGSPNYLSSFDPLKLLSSIDHLPRVQFTEMIANGRPVKLQPSGEMTFSYTINNFIFKWTITDYNNPAKNRYYYRLKGIDNEWRFAGNHGQVEFANLSPGKYILLLKSENSNGVTANKILSINFLILLPFWRTWWFFALVFLGIAGFFYSLYRYRLNQALKFEKLRNKISLDLHDDIGSTLSSISILSEMALHENKPAEAEEMLYEIKENSLSVMERMDDIVWSINPHNDSLESLFLRIKTFASRLFEAKEINYTILIDEKIKHAQLRLGYRQHIYLILKEAINNLIKYSKCSQASIIVGHTGSHLSILVRDNGKGFDVQNTKYGNGLNSMKHRASDMHADLKITSEKNHGTEILLQLKIK